MLQKVRRTFQLISQISQSVEIIRAALGRIEARQLTTRSAETDLSEVEFQVYSQWGEDGILQHILRHAEVNNRMFVEFGVENYLESNTRFLLTQRGWHGIVFDGSEKNIDFIKTDPIYWRYNLKAERAFIDKENINSLLEKNGAIGEIGLLSIDIDGNDYWVWQSIEKIHPIVVVCEYNAIFGDAAEVTIPYDPIFERRRGHYSNRYFGASLAALTRLAKNKGYALVGVNSNGCNAFFVKEKFLGRLKEKSCQEVFQQASFRDTRNIDGKLNFISQQEGLSLISHLPIVDLSDGKTKVIREIF